VDECRPLPQLNDFLGSLKGPATRPWRLLRNLSERTDGQLPQQTDRDKQLAAALSELRLIKDAQEERERSPAIQSTIPGFEHAIRVLRDAKSAPSAERHVEGVCGLRARVEGNDVGYGTIAASGAHACVLHWTRNDGPLKKGQLLLLDAGVEGNSLYT